MEQGWANWVAQLFTLWEIPAAVLSSFVAHLFLVILANIRRRSASGVLMLVLGLAYQFANWVAPWALSNLSLCTPSPRQQLIAFWAPFLLHHLGGPDNISALCLEDNVLSGREVLTVISNILGAGYVLYKHVYSAGGALVPASIIIFIIGAAKYADRAFALWQGDLSNIRSSMKQEKKQITPCSDPLITMGCHYLLRDEEALMVAHEMFPICKSAMSDSSIDVDDHNLKTRREILTLRWENMCSVVEMELSLMYDILYTKAAVVHTWYGYLIRVVTPLAIAVSIVLFGFYNKKGQAIPDVIITYTLLLGTFVLDTRWLLRALGSTWMHTSLHASSFLRAVFGTGKWHWLRGVVVSLDLGRLSLTGLPVNSSSYRRWSGTVGQHSLLRECTQKISICGKAAKGTGLEDVWNEYRHSKGHKLSDHVKEAVFTRVSKVLRSTYEQSDEDEYAYSMKDITTSWGQVTTARRQGKLKKLRLAFGYQFQEDIIVWHIATQVFLLRVSDESLISRDENAATHANAINAMSKYLMFLIAVCRHMLPGLALRSLYEITLEYLKEVNPAGSSSSSATRKEEKLAEILLNKKLNNWGLSHNRASVVRDASILANELLRADHLEMPLLELVFNVWVDKLQYAATGCSLESHAKQLSRGGDLTTIIWIMAQHAGPFQIGQRGPDSLDDQQEEKKPEEKKPEAKKPKEKKPEAKKPEEKKPEEKKPEERKPDEKKPDRKPRPKEKASLPQIPHYPPIDRHRRYATLYPVD